MSEEDKLKLQNLRTMQSRLNQQSGVPSTPQVSENAVTPIGIGDIAKVVSNKRQPQQAPPAKIERYQIGKDGSPEVVYEDNPEYYKWQKQTDEDIKNAPALEKRTEQIKEKSIDMLRTIKEVEKGVTKKYFGPQAERPGMPWEGEKKGLGKEF